MTLWEGCRQPFSMPWSRLKLLLLNCLLDGDAYVAETVYIVHCVDSEGPIYEPLDARFQRLVDTFNITGIEFTPENMALLEKGKLDLGGKEELVSQVLGSHLANFLDDWSRLEEMLSKVTSPDFRNAMQDSLGQGYVFNWFCMDHVGYQINPRRRTLGYLAIFDFYKHLLTQRQNDRDGLHWHFHPMSTYREAHRCATSLLNSPHIWEGIARRIIEREWFPSCVRCGFQSERPDVHWFLEQYVPFDFTNTSVENPEELETQADLSGGRFGDWRLAPKDWGVYHPSHDYYQLPGNCRRLIARSLNLLNRFANLDQSEVDKAFSQANRGRPALLGVASHDFRDLGREVEHLRGLIIDAQRRFPSVSFQFTEARDAMKAVAYEGQLGEPIELEMELIRDSADRPKVLTVGTKHGKVFGPQPFLAIKTKSQRFIHDNLDFSTDLENWRYVFDAETVLPEDLAAVGIGAADRYGNTWVSVLENN